MDTTLSHSKRLALLYIGSKGRHVAWTEEFKKGETFIPKYKDVFYDPRTKISNHQSTVIELCKRLLDGEKTIRIEGNAGYTTQLRRAGERLGLRIKYVATDCGIFVSMLDKNKHINQDIMKGR
jgi:hypothetical protein